MNRLHVTKIVLVLGIHHERLKIRGMSKTAFTLLAFLVSAIAVKNRHQPIRAQSERVFRKRFVLNSTMSVGHRARIALSVRVDSGAYVPVTTDPMVVMHF